MRFSLAAASRSIKRVRAATIRSIGRLPGLGHTYMGFLPVIRAARSNTSAGAKWKAITQNVLIIRELLKLPAGYHNTSLQGFFSKNSYPIRSTSSHRIGFTDPDVQL
jgi:hypothetical protein